MTRRLRLVSMLVALMALSGAYVAPTGGAYARRLAAVLSVDAHRRETRACQSRVAARAMEPPAQPIPDRQSAGASSIAVPLSRFQRPPPSIL